MRGRSKRRLAKGEAVANPDAMGYSGASFSLGEKDAPATKDDELFCRPRGPALNALPDPATLPFEKAMQELEEIVAALEKSSVSLDELVKLFERGEALKRRCDALLKEAEARIEKIALGEDGKPSGLAPLDPE